MAKVTAYSCDICNKLIDTGKGIMMQNYRELDDQSENYEKITLHDGVFRHYHKTCFINDILYNEMGNDTRLSKSVKEVIEHII